jgi:ElaB/YqjD/DUF883 family membrane-anchored ribosome-binding protein
MVRANGRVSKAAVHDTRRNSRHTSDAIAAEIESIGDRASKLVHQAIEEVTDSIQAGKESIVDHTKHVKEVAEEKITTHPYAAVGTAFAAGMLATVMLRWAMRSRD